MKQILYLVLSQSPFFTEIGRLIIRVGAGIILFIFGYGKLAAGSSHLAQIGNAMALFGIVHGYTFWGLLAALTELCGGLAYIMGFMTRLVSVPLIFLYIVAIKYHMAKKDPFTVWGFPLLFLCITIAQLIAGSGKFSIDYFITNCTQ